MGDAVLQKNRMKADLGLFAQDQWTIKRLTLNYGVRFDYSTGTCRRSMSPPDGSSARATSRR